MNTWFQGSPPRTPDESSLASLLAEIELDRFGVSAEHTTTFGSELLVPYLYHVQLPGLSTNFISLEIALWPIGSPTRLACNWSTGHLMDDFSEEDSALLGGGDYSVDLCFAVASAWLEAQLSRPIRVEVKRRFTRYSLGDTGRLLYLQRR